ncbi:cysteine desulfurase [Rhodopseudomonas thermotolerans]|uniref:Cysteine desulfurase n=2 Tax=Rhodopseudomonas TaxID=1073 RepID=A0A336JVU5_9BRAD|nr:MULTISPECIES: cysteine desulfurase family protein [Rhodopseudomonas]RED29064.1 cysteine desulfurase [Rhodopseudomonas pentothenatexigens]REF92301.1 cysteine desulfurase [Rhodopseudomonas thermotolerans]SSW92476.1 cysteine desulfurase [Rhodopseudomonas pentothenatexigens]
MTERIYLDANATTPLRPEARAAMVAAAELIGNPSSIHAEGRAARAVLEQARADIAAAVGAAARDVVFTSGGTEANALALTPGLSIGAEPADRLLVSAVEHPSVLAGGRFRPEQIEPIPVDRRGVVELGSLRRLLGEGPPALVSVMLANNETGVLQPIREVAEMVHEAGGVLHVDAIQALGKIPFGIKQLGGDLVSLSAHKIGGPKGVGALVLGDRLTGLEPLLRGGGQELGRRAGTENLTGIAGFGAAVAAAMSAMAADMARIERMRNRLEAGLRQCDDGRGGMVVADDTPRLPNTTQLVVPGLRAETAVIGFDLAGIAVSSGSACSSGKVQPSHVLEAMGLGPELARSAIRISLGWWSSESDIDRCLEAWRKLIGNLARRDRETVLERF